MVAEGLHDGDAEALLQHHSSGGAKRQSASGQEDHGAYLYLVDVNAEAAGAKPGFWHRLVSNCYLSMA
jgi:hypothetical protein